MVFLLFWALNADVEHYALQSEVAELRQLPEYKGELLRVAFDIAYKTQVSLLRSQVNFKMKKHSLLSTGL